MNVQRAPSVLRGNFRLFSNLRDIGSNKNAKMSDTKREDPHFQGHVLHMQGNQMFLEEQQTRDARVFPNEKGNFRQTRRIIVIPRNSRRCDRRLIRVSAYAAADFDSTPPHKFLEPVEDLKFINPPSMPEDLY